MLNPSSSNVPYLQHETFNFVMSLLAMPYGDQFFMSRKGVIERWVGSPIGRKSMVMSLLNSRNALVTTRWAISLLCTYELGEIVYEPPFLTVKLSQSVFVDFVPHPVRT